MVAWIRAATGLTLPVVAPRQGTGPSDTRGGGGHTAPGFGLLAGDSQAPAGHPARPPVIPRSMASAFASSMPMYVPPGPSFRPSVSP
jgi:hypothetical protein